MIMDNFDSPFLYNRPQMTVEAIKKSIVYKLIFLIGRSPREASQRDWLNATLHAVRDLVTEGWITTARQTRAEDSRRVYYLSMEFLIGRTLSNAMIAEGIYGLAQEALSELNVDLEEILEKEVDPGLRPLVYQVWVTVFVMNTVCSAKKLKMASKSSAQMHGLKKVRLGSSFVHLNALP